MAFDAFFLSAVLDEVRDRCLGGRVDKIHQPSRDTLILHSRCREGREKFLLAANPTAPRLHLTAASPENPAEPPMFCMLLRKHLLGAKLTAVSQLPMERCVNFTFDCTDEMGFPVQKTLVAELMGRTCNLYLLSPEGRILDCLRRIGLDESAKRPALPGLMYQAPEQVKKLNPRDELDYGNLLKAPGPDILSERLMDLLGGLSPLVCRELAFQAGGATDVRLNVLGPAGRTRLLDSLEGLLALVREHRLSPTLLSRDGAPWDFTFFPVGQYGPLVESVSFPTFSELLDQFYEQREHLERVKQRGQDLIRSVTTARDRTARKIAHQEQELEATRDRERLRELGDILTSNFYQMERGMARLRTVDFYDPDGKEVDIKLDPLLTPQQNAAKYYKEYNKAKTAETVLTQQLEKNRRELDYLNSVLDTIPLAEGERDLQEIRQELTDTGYLRRPSKAKGREKRVSSKPMEFRSSSGLRISVGKNNTQNDLLTCKQAFKSDIWFHTQKIHGSHVILWTEGREPDLQSVHEAACLAAWFSQARESSKVPVDYTPVKYVKKPNGARPGMVIYTTYETAWVTPDGELAKKLRVR